jgi:hypothetical protein
MSVEGLHRLVDFYAAGTQVAGVLFCVNVQRALFDSHVWETFWDGYDPALGEGQPALKRTHGVRNHLLLRERGLDQHAVWLERCRHHGIEGWLTMRMNDCHGLKEYMVHEQGLQGGDVCRDDWTIHWPSQFWREHPELRRAPYRFERSWEGAFDYGKAEVREHHLALIRELFERYDMFGLEMDWMRWGMYFAPGYEQAGRPLLTEFVREVRRLAGACEKRVGHRVRLAHRLPANPESCLALGFDPITWAREGLRRSAGAPTSTVRCASGAPCWATRSNSWRWPMPMRSRIRNVRSKSTNCSTAPRLRLCSAAQMGSTCSTRTTERPASRNCSPTCCAISAAWKPWANAGGGTR